MSHALVSFGRVAQIKAGAATDGTDEFFPRIVSVGSGVWVSAWASEDSLGGTIGDSDRDILFVRSTDDGETWSPPAALNTDAAMDGFRDEFDVDLAVGMSNVTIAAWSTSTSFVGTQFARSTDDGATWSAPITVGPTGADHEVVTDSAGTWLIVWHTGDDFGGTVGTDRDLVFVRSLDNGLTWSSPQVLNTNAASDGASDDESPALATDGAGNWVVVWERVHVFAASSFDNGATWTAPVSATPVDPGLSVPVPDVATDGSGTWLLVWNGSEPVPGTGTDSDIFRSTSTDIGLSWSTPVALYPEAATDSGNDGTPTMIFDQAGLVYVAWQGSNSLDDTIGSDPDILISRSLDGGNTWTSAAALNTSAAKDRKKGFTIETDAAIVLGYDGVERWVAVWTSWLAFDGDTEYDADTVFATSRDDCPAAPSMSCRVPGPSKTSLRVVDGDGGRDLISWSWKGQETLLADFGDPLSTSDYVLCLYDHVASSAVLVSEHDMPAGETCKGKPCWSSTSSGPQYRDRSLEHGPIKVVKLVAGADGKAKIKLKAKGPTVAPPRLPLDVSPDVTAQLHNLETGECWSAAYTSALDNDTGEFKAKTN